MRIPERGLSKDELFGRLEAFRKNDMPWREGRTFAYIYDPGPEAEEVIKRAFTSYMTENGLDPTVFPSTLHLENEVVGMAISHLRGGPDAAGSFTSGGTESILLALKTARDFAREKRPSVREPEVLLPSTAHASFQKAAHYLGLKAVIVPVDPRTFRADVEAMRAAVTPNTILLVGSATSYAHGVVDPIRELGALALEKDLLLHVDGCIGGFLLPFFRRLGAPVPEFDFSVPGVTSMSMDFHKYAYAAKGASVVLYRSSDLRRYQLYACSNWTGYTIINPTVQSTKSAGPVAACWAVLHFLGDNGYLEMARQMYEGTRKIVAGIQQIAGLRILGEPDGNLVAFTSDEFSVFHLVDEMKERGWYIQPQLAYETSKENIHLSLGPSALRWADAFIADLRSSVELARGLPSGDVAGQLREALASVDVSQLSAEAFTEMLAMAGVSGSGLPGRMAQVNELLNGLPVPLRERLLVEYLNQLFTARRAA